MTNTIQLQDFTIKLWYARQFGIGKRTKRSTQQNREPRNRPYISYSASLYDKWAKVIQWSISSTSDAGTNEHPCKKRIQTHTNGYHRSKCKTQNYKLLKDSIRVCNDFLDKTP